MKLSRRLAGALSLGFIFVAALPALALATAIRVTPTGSTSPGCGDTWVNGCTLQYALQTVATSSDELWVKTGTYTPGNTRPDTFNLRVGVSLYGGFAGTETSRGQRNATANVTTLSGDIGTAGVNTDNSYHVVTSNNASIGTDTVLDGFTVSGGYATDSPASTWGGGMLVQSGSPTVSNCTFSANSATEGGGMVATASLTVRACTFLNNSAAEGNGGAMHLTTGAGLTTIDSCTFSGNSCMYGGGAINISDATAPTIVNSTFSGNSTGGTGYGGGIQYDNSGGTVVNCTFFGNSAGISGGGAIFGTSSVATGPTIANSIFWGNSPNAVRNHSASVTTISTSIVQAGCPSGSTCSGVIDSDPNLGALGSYGGPGQTFLLTPGSPAIDTGDDAVCAAAPVSGASQNGLPRPQGTHCDLGAFELGQGIFRSVGTADGWILESAETSNRGGSMNRVGTTLFVGDNAADRQYRSIVAFDSSPLPTGAQILTATLRLHYAGKVNTNPFLTHGALSFDMRKGGFSGSNTLQTGDFQAPPSRVAAGTVPKAASSSWHTATLSPAARGYINTAGQTQFRLRFAKDDNNDEGTDAVKFHSGNAPLNYRPQLTVFYYVP